MKRIAALLIVVLTVLAQSCIPRYTLNGASIDYNVYKTISFGEFPIRAALVYPPLQQMFENRMMDMVAQQTRLRVNDNVNTDLRMEGEITGYNLTPQAVGEDAYASQTRLTISVRVKYINNRNPDLSMDQTFSAYRDFSSSEMLTDVQDELCNQICKDLSDLIFNATLGDW
ncbi:MAG: LptE family protein [Bacteroidales bacterium]|nr:LptE family protein [Candidatus Sodaliphilus aphodohippi]